MIGSAGVVWKETGLRKCRVLVICLRIQWFVHHCYTSFRLKFAFVKALSKKFVYRQGDSLIPYAFVKSRRLSCEIRRRMSSIGIGDPAAIPVLLNILYQLISRYVFSTAYRNLVISSLSPFAFRFSTSPRTPRKCVGTPCRAVHRSCVTASTIADGLNISLGYTMQDPCTQAARLPSTRRVHGNRRGSQIESRRGRGGDLSKQ